MLAVTSRAWSSLRNGRSSARSMACAIRVASRAFAPGSRIANSSPPSRAIRCSASIGLRRRAPIWRSSASPTWCPELSLTSLKLSMSSNSKTALALVAIAFWISSRNMRRLGRSVSPSWSAWCSSAAWATRWRRRSSPCSIAFLTAGPSPVQRILEDIVHRAQPHGRDRQVLADGTRDDDKGDIQAHLLHDLQRPDGIELRLVIVGQDQVELGVEVGLEARLIVHPAPVEVIAGPTELVKRQVGVLRPVFQDQNAQRSSSHWVQRCNALPCN